jgi:hypothetical protein
MVTCLYITVNEGDSHDHVDAMLVLDGSVETPGGRVTAAR